MISEFYRKASYIQENYVHKLNLNVNKSVNEFNEINVLRNFYGGANIHINNNERIHNNLPRSISSINIPKSLKLRKCKSLDIITKVDK